MSRHDVHRDDMFDEDPTLEAFARELLAAAAAAPAPAIGSPLAAILEGRAPVTVYPEVVETPRARVVRRPGRLRWAVAGAAFTLSVGSLGVAGALPGPVQRQVARMAEVIGVDVPDGDDDAPTTTTTTPTTTTTTSTTIATTTSTAPPVGTTILSGGQDAGENERGRPENPGRRNDDDNGRGRGRGGNVDEVEDIDDVDDAEEIEARDDRQGTSGPDPGVKDEVDAEDEPHAGRGGADDDLAEDGDAKSSEQA